MPKKDLFQRINNQRQLSVTDNYRNAIKATLCT